ncbi:MAG: AI-2E family transporter [Candidatus Nomurabacteria bacterium]|jgi:predicted PurR-regulated permease PerM|nr:AI-2E family transporter [Candidatus Nomurabacteria bacterium]
MKESQIHISTKTLIRFWLVIIGFAVVIAALWVAQTAVIMILVAAFLALVLNRPVNFFTKVLPGHRRGLGILITFLIFVFVIGGSLLAIMPVFFEQTINFVKNLPDTIAAIEGQSRFMFDAARDSGLHEQLGNIVDNVSDTARHAASSLGSASVTIVSNIAAWFVNACIVLVLTLFMLLDGPRALNSFWRIAYKDAKKRDHHRAVVGKMYDVVSSFVTSQVIIAAVCGLLAGVGVFVLSMVFGFTVSIVLPIAAIVFITTFVPLFGPYIGGAISTILVALYNPIAALIFVVYLVLYQQIEYNLLAPKIQSKKMNVSATLILISLIIGMQIAGIFGALVAIPVAGCVMVLVREYALRRRSGDDQDVDIDVREVVIPKSKPGKTAKTKK